MKQINIEGKEIRLVKIDEVQFKGGLHPNGINNGYTKEGKALQDIIVGYPFSMTDKYREFGGLRTSPITEIIDHNTFRTLNSIYEIQVL